MMPASSDFEHRRFEGRACGQCAACESPAAISAEAPQLLIGEAGRSALIVVERLIVGCFVIEQLVYLLHLPVQCGHFRAEFAFAGHQRVAKQRLGSFLRVGAR